MEKKQEVALKLFNSGFNCAQAVIGAFACGDGELILKLAGSFGGGMRCGEVCGAATGALMAIGLKEGQFLPGDLAAKEKCGKLTLQFMAEFEKRLGTLLCRELLGYDVRDTGAREKHGAKREICEEAIKTALDILAEMAI